MCVFRYVGKVCWLIDIDDWFAMRKTGWPSEVKTQLVITEPAPAPVPEPAPEPDPAPVPGPDPRTRAGFW
jgi:hypothetical protein